MTEDFSDNAPKFKGTVILCGGSLLYIIIWTKGNTFEIVADQYTKFVKQHFQLSECRVKEVFDSYPQLPTAQTQKAPSKIRVAIDTVLGSRTI